MLSKLFHVLSCDTVTLWSLAILYDVTRRIEEANAPEEEPMSEDSLINMFGGAKVVTED